MYKYKRIDEIVKRTDIDNWLNTVIDGGRIIYYTEFPAHPEGHLRIQMIVEHADTKTKKRLFS